MAIAFGAQATNATPTTTSVTHTAQLTLSAGDLAVVLISARDDQAISSVVGDVNGEYTVAGTVNHQAATGQRSAIYHFQNCASGTETVTVTWAGTVRASINFSRWTGAATTGALDQTNELDNVATTTPNHGSITTTGAGLIVTAYSPSGDPGATTQTGFTALTRGPSFVRDWYGYRIVTGSTTEDGDLSTTNTLSGPGNIASFNEAASALDPIRLIWRQ